MQRIVIDVLENTEITNNNLPSGETKSTKKATLFLAF